MRNKRKNWIDDFTEAFIEGIKESLTVITRDKNIVTAARDLMENLSRDENRRGRRGKRRF